LKNEYTQKKEKGCDENGNQSCVKGSE